MRSLLEQRGPFRQRRQRLFRVHADLSAELARANSLLNEIDQLLKLLLVLDLQLKQVRLAERFLQK